MENKITVAELDIVVSATAERPYYQIKYRLSGHKDYNIGFGSYNLKTVIYWKENNFIVKEEGETKCDELMNDKISDAIDVIVPTLLALITAEMERTNDELTAEMERTNDEDKNKENFVKVMALMGLSESMNDFCKKYIYKENEKDKKDKPSFDIGILKILGGF